MANYPIEADFMLVSEPRVEAWTPRELYEELLAMRIMGLFPRAQVPGLVLTACYLVAYDPVAG